MSSIEEGNRLTLDFRKIAKVADGSRDVVPVVLQDADTGDVILLAYTNEEAFRKSMKTQTVNLWSTSRCELWEKGKTSGHTFKLIEAYVNCEQNSLLYRVRSTKGGICHTRNESDEPRNCFYRRIDLETFELENLDP